MLGGLGGGEGKMRSIYFPEVVVVRMLLTLLLALFGGVAYGGVECAEELLQVTSHGNGNVYFMIDQTCSRGLVSVELG